MVVLRNKKNKEIMAEEDDRLNGVRSHEESTERPHPPLAPPGYVPEEAFNNLQDQMAEMLEQLTQLKGQRAIPASPQEDSSYVPTMKHQGSRGTQLDLSRSLRSERENSLSRAQQHNLPAAENRHYEEELRAIKERLDKFERKKGKVEDPSAMLRQSPFTRTVLEAPVPRDFHLPKLAEYDGTEDPWQHANKYRDLMLLYGLADEIQCRAFSSTLTRAAHDWFTTLPPSSIGSFSELARAFTQQFVTARKRKRSSIHLVTIKQHETESLRKYVQRFNNAMLEMKEVSLDNAASALMSGTTNIDLKRHLVTNPPETMDDLMATAEVYINAEELGIYREKSHEPQEKKDRVTGKRNDQPNSRCSSQFEAYTPLNELREEILMQIRKDGYLTEDPPRMRGNSARRDKSRYCNYHQDHGHTTEECDRLKNELEKLVREGSLHRFTELDDRRTRKSG